MTGWRLEHTYTQLPAFFYSEATPVRVAAPRLVAFNGPLAASLGLEVAGTVEVDLDHPDLRGVAAEDLELALVTSASAAVVKPRV